MPDSDHRAGITPPGHAANAPPGSAFRGSVCQTPDPIAVIEEDHALQLELYDVLEHLAASLPETIDQNLAALAITILRNGLAQHMNLEEEVLFPLIRIRIAGTPHLLAMLRQLEDEHDADETSASEIADALSGMARGERPQQPVILSYMLRGFCQSQRRHIALENEVVLPLARQVLTAADLAEFQARIMASSRPVCTRQSLTSMRKASGGIAVCGSCASGSKVPTA